MGKTDLRRENIIIFVAKAYSGTEEQNIKKKKGKKKNKRISPFYLSHTSVYLFPQAQLVSFSTWYFWLLSLPLAAWDNRVLKAMGRM